MNKTALGLMVFVISALAGPFLIGLWLGVVAGLIAGCVAWGAISLFVSAVLNTGSKKANQGSMYFGFFLVFAASGLIGGLIHAGLSAAVSA